MQTEQMKNTSVNVVMNSLDSGRRILAYTPEIEDDYKKKFKYLSPDQQLLGFAMDEVAMKSDCFILYAIAYYGVATKEMIVDFLRMKSRTGPALLMIKKDELDTFMSVRLRVLMDRGYVFSFYYGIGKTSVHMYGVTEEAYQLIRQRLDKVTFSLNHGIAMKSVRRLIDWAAAGYVGGRLMQSPRVQCELGRTFFNKKIKNSFLPFEFLSKGADGALFYVAGINGTWDMDPDVQTQREYEEWLKVQADLLWCYLNLRSEKGTPIACVVVRDSDTLYQTATMIARAEGLRGCLDRIVFTGEGVFRDKEAEKSGPLYDNAFLQMHVEGNRMWFQTLTKVTFL